MQKWIKDIFSILCLMYCLNAWTKTINIGNGYDRLRYIKDYYKISRIEKYTP